MTAAPYICPECKETGGTPSVEAMAVFAADACSECAAVLFEDGGKAHILHAMGGE